MFPFRRALLAAAALGIWSIVINDSALAVSVTVYCPGTAITTDREFSVTTDPGTAVCIGAAPGNISGNNDAVNQLGYVTLDKSDDALQYLGTLNELTISGVSTRSGSFSFTAPAGYHHFVLALKSGNGVLDPDWAAFLLPDGVTSGRWAIAVGNQSLSHINLYAQACANGNCNPRAPEVVNEVPLPHAVILFGSALAGMGMLATRRQRRGAV